MSEEIRLATSKCNQCVAWNRVGQLEDEVERMKRKYEHAPMVHTVADKCRLNSHIQKLQEMRISVSDIQIEVSAERGLEAAARTRDRRNKAVKLMTDLIVSLVDLQHDMGKEGGR